MTRVIAMRDIMFTKIVDGIFDCIFMTMVVAASILGTLAFGL